MKKTLVLIGVISLFISCKKNSKETITKEEKVIAIETIDTTSKKNLIIDKEGITDFVIVNDLEKNCEAHFLSILNSSKKFNTNINGLEKAIKKNGGIGLTIKLEKDNDNVKYFVSETYSDKSTVISTYVFNITTNKLFEQDYILSDMEEIDFDQNLLKKNNLYCDDLKN